MGSLLSTMLGRLRVVAFTEGVSFLILLFVAMPLKYILGQPSAVAAFGRVHGVLFVLYIALVVLCAVEYGWKWRKIAILLLISVIPFGNFYADKHYLQAEN